MMKVTAIMILKQLEHWAYEYNNRSDFNRLFTRNWQGAFPFESAIFHAQGLHTARYYTPRNLELWSRICTLFFSGDRRDPEIPPTVSIITCTNRRDPGLLEKSLQHIGFDFKRFYRLGENVHTWRYIEKLRLINEVLPALTTPYVLYCDSHDVLVSRLSGLLQIFDSYSCDMLLNAEKKLCFPMNYNREFELKTWRESSLSGEDYQFLNSGVWIAKAEFARYFFQKSLAQGAVAASPFDDQMVFKRMFSEHYPQIRLDYSRKAFQTLQFAKVKEIKLKDRELPREFRIEE